MSTSPQHGRLSKWLFGWRLIAVAAAIVIAVSATAISLVLTNRSRPLTKAATGSCLNGTPDYRLAKMRVVSCGNADVTWQVIARLNWESGQAKHCQNALASHELDRFDIEIYRVDNRVASFYLGKEWSGEVDTTKDPFTLCVVQHPSPS
jgi:hypothetical protein